MPQKRFIDSESSSACPDFFSGTDVVFVVTPIILVPKVSLGTPRGKLCFHAKKSMN